MIMAATGHRPDKLGREYDYNGPITTWIRQEIEKILIDEKPTKIISGMAIGVDQIFALVGLKLNIPLLAAIPFEGQEKRWPKSSQKIFYDILNNPLTEQVIVCEGGYAGYKFIRRDHYMVDNCNKLLAVYNGDESGGTWQTWKYAIKNKCPIIRINPNDCPSFYNSSTHQNN